MESEIFCRKCYKFQEKKGGGVPSFDGGQPPRQGRRDATDGKITKSAICGAFGTAKVQFTANRAIPFGNRQIHPRFDDAGDT